MAGHSSKNVEEIQKLMPDDFNRKLKEWEQIKETGVGRQAVEEERSCNRFIGPNPSGQISSQRRKSSSSSNSRHYTVSPKNKKALKKRRIEKYSDKLSGLETATSGFVVSGTKSTLVGAMTVQERDSAWLEREIQKVQKEKESLDRERLKFAAKEEKLQKMHHAMLLRKQLEKNKENTTEEITVKTAKGEEFKFEGISEKFTRKIFEWEERKGIAPESSTIALINPQYATG